MYRLETAPSADRDLQRLVRRAPRDDYEAIEAAIDSLVQNPRPSGTVKLVGEDAYRIRVRKYRIIYQVDDQAQLVVLLRVVPRAQAYR